LPGKPRIGFKSIFNIIVETFHPCVSQDYGGRHVEVTILAVLVGLFRVTFDHQPSKTGLPTLDQRKLWMGTVST